MGNKNTKKEENQKVDKISQIFSQIVDTPQPPQQPQPQIITAKNPYPQVPNYLDLVNQSKPASKYPEVPNYITHELITDIKMLKHILDTASTNPQKSILKHEYLNQSLHSSRLVDVNKCQTQVQQFQSELLNQIKSGQLSQESISLKQNQVMESLKLIAKYAFYCQGLLSQLPTTSREFQVAFNNLILSTNMNSILLQYITFYDQPYLSIRQKMQLLWQEFHQNNQFHLLIQQQLIIVNTQLQTVNNTLQKINECSGIMQLEDENEETFIQHYQRIQLEADNLKVSLTVAELQEQKKHQQLAIEKALIAKDDQKFEKFVKEKLDDSEGSQQFTLLLRHFVEILEKKPLNWQQSLSQTMLSIKEKEKVRWLLIEFSRLDIQSSLHLVHYCISQLQYKVENDKSVAQLQRVVEKIDKI